MGWNSLSILKLQRFNRWSLGMIKESYPILNNGCNYLSMLGLKLNNVSQRDIDYSTFLLSSQIKVKIKQRKSTFYEIGAWVNFHLSNTQAWVRNSTPPQGISALNTACYYSFQKLTALCMTMGLHCRHWWCICSYRKVSNIRRTKSQNWNASHLTL